MFDLLKPYVPDDVDPHPYYAVFESKSSKTKLRGNDDYSHLSGDKNLPKICDSISLIETAVYRSSILTISIILLSMFLAKGVIKFEFPPHGDLSSPKKNHQLSHVAFVSLMILYMHYSVCVMSTLINENIEYCNKCLKSNILPKIKAFNLPVDERFAFTTMSSILISIYTVVLASLHDEDNSGSKG
jgi:hypothetical protein